MGDYLPPGQYLNHRVRGEDPAALAAGPLPKNAQLHQTLDCIVGGLVRAPGELASSLPLDLFRYVRAATVDEARGQAGVDVITRDENVRWTFHPETADEQVGALAALLAASMAIPDDERLALTRRGTALLARAAAETQAPPTGEVAPS